MAIGKLYVLKYFKIDIVLLVWFHLAYIGPPLMELVWLWLKFKNISWRFRPRSLAYCLTKINPRILLYFVQWSLLFGNRLYRFNKPILRSNLGTKLILYSNTTYLQYKMEIPGPTTNTEVATIFCKSKTLLYIWVNNKLFTTLDQNVYV